MAGLVPGHYDSRPFRGGVLIVNAMTHTIVDLFSETRPVT
jgi:3-hydroxymyristoyl/3-hydroxydecanoyl-(acyl carrier protein) dehydratase